jgi:hypothetical protein
VEVAGPHWCALGGKYQARGSSAARGQVSYQVGQISMGNAPARNGVADLGGPKDTREQDR